MLCFGFAPHRPCSGFLHTGKVELGLTCIWLSMFHSPACHEVSGVCADCQWDYLCNCDITLGDGLSIVYEGLAQFRTEKDTMSHLRLEL